jgi:hypothetical protein
LEAPKEVETREEPNTNPKFIVEHSPIVREQGEVIRGKVTIKTPFSSKISTIKFKSDFVNGASTKSFSFNGKKNLIKS